ncbi:neuraminidase-like domain-containing protein [Pseudomonas sp. dw_612]|uniref:Tc toxin subunit A-related protein n=1 Tax=Pseudomonas sp. dw_612 TaxID=2720080 RepID=UPI001BD60988|nr:neuraminidase-like domain-containing protein [Pseudomonas sp. dw_612]
MDRINIAGLLEQRRSALVDYCIGQVKKAAAPNDTYKFVRTPADLFELLRLDPLDSYAVQSSWAAEAISCAQQYIHAVYRKLEPGYSGVEFDKDELNLWQLYSNYPDWAALQMIAAYPENYINPFVRQRKTSLFKALENNLNQSRLTTDSVQLALQDYLQTFEQICNLDVISGYIDGASATSADYYFIGRQRVQPFQYFWRKADIVLQSASTSVNPAAWSEWQPVEIPTTENVLDMRPVYWSGRLCVVWADWQEKRGTKGQPDYAPHRLDINVAFMTQNGQWSGPLSLHSSGGDDAMPGAARLIATVVVDEVHPKGKLCVLCLRPDNTEKNVYAARDILFRPIDNDDALMDMLAQYRFVDRDTVQHSILSLSRPTITETIDPPGRLTPFYALHAVVLRSRKTTGTGEEDVLLVCGECAENQTGQDSSKTFELKLVSPAGGDPAPFTGSFPERGGWRTPWMAVRRDSFASTVTFEFGGLNAVDGLGRKKYALNFSQTRGFVTPTLNRSDPSGAQFLDFNQLAPWLKYVRLNSLHGPELVQASAISVDAVLDWSMQHRTEPPPTSGTISEPNGAFDGANGLFFWELHCHLPLLVTARLRAEDRYTEAQDWLHYLFDPQAPAVATPAPAKPRYWRCRPLANPDAANPGFEADAPTDPDAIGYSNPRHFQILAFTEYVKNLMAWGDWYYRQLSRDSLVAAKLCYVQAEFLMGNPPTARTVNRWTPATVGALLNSATTRPALEAFERSLVLEVGDLAARAKAAPLLGRLASEPFKLPINEQLQDLFQQPVQRLHNLRNNLTLDGQPLQVPLFSPPTDPNQLLRDLAAGGGGAPRPMGGRLVVVAFRWRVMFEAALRAVQALQDYGNQLLRLLEQRDRAEMEQLQQGQLVELGTYAQTVQEHNIAQLQASVSALQQSRTMAQQRADAYNRRYEQNITDVEYSVMNALHQAKGLTFATKAIKFAGASAAVAPNIFGVASGGFRLEKLPDAVVHGLEMAATLLELDAGKSATTETYRRRRGEWQMQRDQALVEVSAITEQINAQTHAVASAKASQDHTLRANSHALTLYNFLQKRATNAELFGWLVGQFKALHYQAYDAVVSLCINAQASMSAETGDYDTQIPLPQVWLDNRHGLTAGEHLRGHLLRMEREYLQRHERRLELIKTVSLRQLFDDPLDPQTGLASWKLALEELQSSGQLEFRLSQLSFDRDHPGHYCRQISSVEVDLPVLAGPYENVQATLLQISSMTATKASARSVEYLYAPAESVAPADIQINLRSGQQIALSSGLADTGMTATKPDEGLLNPFECTGAVSNWQLNWSWPKKAPQQAMLASLTDVIVRVRYTARAGDPSFALKVRNLVTAAESRAAQRVDAGAIVHE